MELARQYVAKHNFEVPMLVDTIDNEFGMSVIVDRRLALSSYLFIRD